MSLQAGKLGVALNVDKTEDIEGISGGYTRSTVAKTSVKYVPKRYYDFSGNDKNGISWDYKFNDNLNLAHQYSTSKATYYYRHSENANNATIGSLSSSTKYDTDYNRLQLKYSNNDLVAKLYLNEKKQDSDKIDYWASTGGKYQKLVSPTTSKNKSKDKVVGLDLQNSWILGSDTLLLGADYKRECYTNTVAVSGINDTNRIRIHEIWYPVVRIGSHMYIMTCHCLGGVKYAPLYIHSFQLLQPRRLLEAERFNIKYTDPLAIATVADKLRYYRHKKALRQKDMAEKTGTHLATYCAYELEDRKIPYPLDQLSKIAELFGIEVTDLLDDYNLFLYNGQGRQIRAWRQSLGLTKREFGKLYGFHAHTVNQWENDNIQILKSTWVKLFDNE